MDRTKNQSGRRVVRWESRVMELVTSSWTCLSKFCSLSFLPIGCYWVLLDVSLRANTRSATVFIRLNNWKYPSDKVLPDESRVELLDRFVFFFTSFRGSLFFCVCSSRSYRFSHIRNAIRGDLHVVESNFPTLLSFHFSLLLFCLFACLFFFVFVFFSFMNIASVMERLPTNRIACDECGVYRKRTAVTVESTLQTGT